MTDEQTQEEAKMLHIYAGSPPSEGDSPVNDTLITSMPIEQVDIKHDAESGITTVSLPQDVHDAVKDTATHLAVAVNDVVEGVTMIGSGVDIAALPTITDTTDPTQPPETPPATQDSQQPDPNADLPQPIVPVVEHIPNLFTRAEEMIRNIWVQINADGGRIIQEIEDLLRSKKQ